MGVSPQNHPFLIGFSIINHPFWGTQNEFLETPESSATHFFAKSVLWLHKGWDLFVHQQVPQSKLSGTGPGFLRCCIYRWYNPSYPFISPFIYGLYLLLLTIMLDLRKAMMQTEKVTHIFLQMVLWFWFTMLQSAYKKNTKNPTCQFGDCDPFWGWWVHVTLPKVGPVTSKWIKSHGLNHLVTVLFYLVSFSPPQKHKHKTCKCHYITNPNFMHFFGANPSKITIRLCMNFDPSHMASLMIPNKKPPEKMLKKTGKKWWVPFLSFGHKGPSNLGVKEEQTGSVEAW